MLNWYRSIPFAAMAPQTNRVAMPTLIQITAFDTEPTWE
jgi:hypothetical protein